MATAVNPPRGMRDFLPAEKALREHALGVIRESYLAEGFDEIETPVVEDISRLHSGLGGDNEKLSYSVLKRGLTEEDLTRASALGSPADLADLGLRFDLTVPLARYYASHRAELPTVFRSIQIAPVWRAERPQKGRYRQFVQCDIDVIGDPSILAEVELITATLATVERLGITGTHLRINDRRLLTAMLDSFGFPAGDHASALVTIDKLDKLGADGVVAELRERGHDALAVDGFAAFLVRPMTLEFRPYGEGQIRKFLPEGLEHEAIDDLVAIGEAVLAARPSGDVLDHPLVFDPFLVRGMGYYTGTIMELMHPEFGYSLGGGGRYDGMIGRFLGTDVPAAGFSIGFERIVDLVAPPADDVAASVALLHESASVSQLAALKAELGREGRRVRLAAKPRNVKRALDELASQGFGHFAFVTATTASVADLDIRPIEPAGT